MIRHPNRGAYKRRRRRERLEREGELLVAQHYAKQRMALAIRQLVNRTAITQLTHHKENE